MSSVAACHVPRPPEAGPPVGLAHGHLGPFTVGAAHGHGLGAEADLSAAFQEPRQQVGHQVLLRVDGVAFTLSEPAVVQPEPAVLGTELAGAVGLSVLVQSFGETVPFQDPHRVGGQESGAGTCLHVGAFGPFQDDAVDSLVHEDVAEHEPGRPGPEDEHIGRAVVRLPTTLSVCHGKRY